MNENDENVDPVRDAAPDVEHLRLEISENREVFYRIDDVTLLMLRRCQQLLFSCFFVSKRELTHLGASPQMPRIPVTSSARSNFAIKNQSTSIFFDPTQLISMSSFVLDGF